MYYWKSLYVKASEKNKQNSSCFKMKLHSHSLSLFKLKKHFIFVIFIVIFCLISFVDAIDKLSNYQSILCADFNCQEAISDGITTNVYPAPEETLLSFKKDYNVKIYGKTGDKHFYFVEINKKRGFVPAKLIKETSIHFDEDKLSDVKFDFQRFFQKSLKRPTSDSKLTSINQSDKNDSIVSSSIDQLGDDTQSNTATPFVYSQKTTVIDGTTIEENLLVTATPSPTFVEKPTTKTVTIEANFTNNIELDKESVAIRESELAKEHSSLFRLVKPMVGNNISVENNTFEENNISMEKINVNVDVDNKENCNNHTIRDEDLSQKNVSIIIDDQNYNKNQNERISEKIVSNTHEIPLSIKTKIEESVVQEEFVESMTSEIGTQPQLQSNYSSSSTDNEILNTSGDLKEEISEQTQNNSLNDNLSSNADIANIANTDEQSDESNITENKTLMTEAKQSIEDSSLSNNQHYPPSNNNNIVHNVLPSQQHLENPNSNIIHNSNENLLKSKDKYQSPELVNIHHGPNSDPYLRTQLNSESIKNPDINSHINYSLHEGHSNPVNSEVNSLLKKPDILHSTSAVDSSSNNKADIYLDNPSDVKTSQSLFNSSALNPNPLPQENSLVDSSHYTPPTNNNIIKRKLLSERIGFVSVIMEVIPDEVELFFESFNISLHAIICTSIIAFFWCLMKVFIFFISSSKKVRELKDTICQTQRKFYYLEAERDKIKEEYNLCYNESSSYKDNLSKIEKRKYQLEQENEKLKNECLILKKDNVFLKSQAESNSQIISKLDSAESELENYKERNYELNSKMEDLEVKIESYLLTIKNYEKTSKNDKEKIDDLNKQLFLWDSKLKDMIKESEQKLNILQLDNTKLKELQNKLNEEIKEIKDELLSSQEKAIHFEKEFLSAEVQLKSSNQKVSILTQELENKKTEIISMQTLLNKLNKNINKEQERHRRSTDINGDMIDSLNGDAGITIDPNEEESNDSICLQDVVQLQLRLTHLEYEKEQFRNKYETVQNQINEMIEDLESTKKLNQQLKEEIKTASEQKMKAVVELEVLSKYYKAKELEYAKDIGVHKIKQEQQNEDVESLNSKLEVTQEENTILKDQLKSVKKELEESERRYKSQLNQLEKQSHENWVAARAAERKYEETKAEASVLRQTLTRSMNSSPPGVETSFGCLDDTTSSISSLPEAVLNSSLPVPPPPPPPPPYPFPSMFAPTMSQPAQPTSAIFDPNELNPSNQTYWGATSIAPPAIPAPIVQASSSIPNANYPYDTSRTMTPVSTNITMTYSPGNPPPETILQQQGQQYGSKLPLNNGSHNQPPSNHPQQQQVHQYNSNPYHYTQRDSYHSSQMDLARNTYSPAMSQRSTNTPLTNPPSIVGYEIPRITSTNPTNLQQSNLYGSSQITSPLTQSSNPDPRLSNNNPFSVNASYTAGYPQQELSHNMYSNPSHVQIYTTNTCGAVQSVIEPNNPYSFHNAPIPRSVTESNQSRPQSVHNQMV